MFVGNIDNRLPEHGLFPSGVYDIIIHHIIIIYDRACCKECSELLPQDE